jgi:hypothetical protein
MAMPHSKAANSPYYSSYVEALAEANTVDTPDITAPVHLNLSESQ